jgi:Predicted enzyme related to lactoylglutathione lyase
LDNNVEVMLYVKNVAENAAFWDAIGFSVLETTDFSGTKLTSIKTTEDSNTIFNLYDIEQVRKMSPEVADNRPSVLFHAKNLDELNEKITAAGGKTSDIMTFENGVRITNFADNEGTYFAVLESN